MRGRQFAGVVLASALVTLDGTSTTVALPAIAHDLSMPISRLQWISNAPMLVLAAFLLPAGSLADRFGRVRMMRIGLLIFMGALAGCALAPTDRLLLAARFALGAGGALLLPATLALVRSVPGDEAERARTLGIWAAWTGAAAAAGPLLAGGIVDFLSWRGVFVPAAASAVGALLLIRSEAPAGAPARREPVPILATFAVFMLLGGLAYLLMAGLPERLQEPDSATAGAVTIAGVGLLARDRRRGVLLPRELLKARNCLPANAATFALYFGLFGLSFVLVLYTQQLLGYSAIRAAVVLLPSSLMLLLAERFGRLAPIIGTRPLVLIGSSVAAAGLAWLGLGEHPLAFWSRLMVGTALFGAGLSLVISPLTHAAVAAAPEKCAGAASGLNHAVVRVAGLAAIALLGSVAAPGFSEQVTADGVRLALLIAAGVVAAGGLAFGWRLRDDEPGGISGEAT